MSVPPNFRPPKIKSHHVLSDVTYPGSPTTMKHMLVYEPPFFEVRVYHHPNGTTIFFCSVWLPGLHITSIVIDSTIWLSILITRYPSKTFTPKHWLLVRCLCFSTACALAQSNSPCNSGFLVNEVKRKSFKPAWRSDKHVDFRCSCFFLTEKTDESLDF